MEESDDKPLDLAYDVYDGEDDDLFTSSFPPVVIFHSSFDNKENWAAIAKEIAEKTVRKVYVLDMRDHGESPKPSNMNHERNVKDLENFILKMHISPVIIGHSLGGTAAMDLAFKKNDLVKELILIDISPLSYPEIEDEFGLGICRIMKQLITEIPNDMTLSKAKSFVYDQTNQVKYKNFRKLIASNLKKDEDGWNWKTNISSLENIANTRAMKKVYPIRGSFHGRTFLIHSDLSGYVIPNKDYAALKLIFPEIKFKCIEECLHLIHFDRPRELTEAIIQHLNEK